MRGVARHLIVHECRTLAADHTAWIMTVVLVASVAYGLGAGSRWRTFEEQTLEAARYEQQGRYAGLRQDVIEINAGRKPAPFADPRKPDMVGSRLAWTYAAMPPRPLAALSIGQSDVLPYYFRVSTASKETVLSSSEIVNPLTLLHGRIDLSFVIVFLLPLFIISLAYNMISIEREEGTLALLLSQPIRLGKVVLIKIGVRAGMIGVALFVPLLLAAPFVRLQPSADTLIRLMLWALVVLAYGAFWCGATVLVAVYGRASATNALSLAALWLLLVLLVPAALNIVVSVLYPMPSRVEMIEAVRTATDGANTAGSRLLAKYYGDHPEFVADTDLDKAMNDAAIVKLAIDDEIERRVRPVAERYEEQLLRQQQLVNRVRLLSPAIIAQDALNDVAGTGASRYRHFVRQVASYHDGWRKYISSLVRRKVRFEPGMYDDLPQFDYQDEPLADVWRRAGTGALTLFMAALVLTALGIARLRHYPVP